MSAFSSEGNKFLWIRVAVCVAIIFALPVVGFLATKAPPEFVLAAILASLGLVAMAKYVELGLIAVVVSGIFVRFRIPTGTSAEIPVSLLIGGGAIALWLLRMFVVEKRFTLRPTPVNYPLLVFIAAVVVSWVWGRVFRDPLVHELGHPLVSVAAGVVMVLLPGSLLLAANHLRSIRWLKALVWVLLGAGAVVLFVDLGYFWEIGPIQAAHTFLRTNGLVHINSHGLLSTWCTALAVALLLFDRQVSWIVRALLVAYVGAWVYWGFYIRITWLSGWVPLFAAVAVIAFLRSKRLCIVLFLVLAIGGGGYYWRTAYHGELEESGRSRWAAYQTNWRVTGQHILFGTGPAGYASYYMSYFPDEAMATHNNYIDVFAQTGLVGLAALMWFFGAQAWGNYRLARELRRQGDFAEALSAAALAGTVGSMVAMALGDWLLPFAYTQSIIGFDLAVLNWIFMGSIWALSNQGNRSQIEDALSN
ncbi:MAG: O-antigen ligase family protein [Anaerolineae bacterium]|nr:O-antigen ligase family protein [Anaerolineae bacterium]